MITMPRRAGTATQSAVRISGEARTSVFCQENEVPKPPRHKSEKNSTGDLPSRIRKIEKSAAAARTASAGMTTASAERAMRPMTSAAGAMRRGFDFCWRGRGHGISRLRHGPIGEAGGRRGGGPGRRQSELR